MGRVFFIIISVVLAFLVEFLFFNFVSPRWTPNLMIVLIVFFNLAFGIRYSIFTAVLAGVIKDAFGLQIFGVNLLTFVVCAYLTTLIKPYLYQAGSNSSRLSFVAAMLIIDFLIRFFLSLRMGGVDFLPAVRYLFFPQAVVTLLVTVELFKQLRQCVLKSFV